MADSSPASVPHPPASASQRQAALQALLPGTASPESIARFEALLAERGCPQDALYLTQTARGRLLSSLVVPSPGRVGMLMQSPMQSQSDAADAAAVAQAATTAAFAHGLHLVQALVSPEDALGQAILRRAGLRDLATLYTLERTLPRRVPPPPPHDEITLIPCLQLPDDRVATVLEATYEGTADCPGLRGLRTAQDTLHGHRSSGTPIDAAWCLVHAQGEDVGVLLVADHGASADLVYTGLTPAWRGKGIGHWLMQAMLHRLHTHGASRIRLCVDAQNGPALQLYRRHGLQRTAASRALIATPQ